LSYAAARAKEKPGANPLINPLQDTTTKQPQPLAFESVLLMLVQELKLMG
jgi:hypothetical protein